MKLRKPVMRAARNVTRGRATFADLNSLLSGFGPRAVQLEDLGPMHLALAAAGHQPRLRVAPTRQRLGPFGGTLNVEPFHADGDHDAVGQAHHLRSYSI